MIVRRMSRVGIAPATHGVALPAFAQSFEYKPGAAVLA